MAIEFCCLTVNTTKGGMLRDTFLGMHSWPPVHVFENLAEIRPGQTSGSGEPCRFGGGRVWPGEDS